MIFRRFSVLVLGAVLALGFGCKPKEPTESEVAAPVAAPKPPRPSIEEVWTGAELAFIREKFGELESLPSGLLSKTIAPGEGEAVPSRANLCSVLYRGTFLDGRTFDERLKQPFRFRVGVGQVIKGWDEAVGAMHKGEKRLIVVPYWLGYGAQGRIPVIMPRTTLVFEIELLDWESTARVPGGPGAN